MYIDSSDMGSHRATDGPTDKILDRKPVPKRASLFTMTMWKMIIGQAIYQLAITLTLYFAGDRILAGVINGSNPQLQLDTIIFNTFVWMQIFNEFNNRRLDNNFNIFEGMFKNYWFLGINCIMVGGQIMIIFVGGVALGVTPLTGVQWAICISCAICCLPWAVLLRILPDRYFAVVFNFVVGNLTFVLRPVAKGFGYVTHMTGKLFTSLWVLVKRLSRRLSARRQHGNDANQDEEAGSLSEVPSTMGSPTLAQSGPSPPPITVTSAD
jgi:Ca2+-transporting ATPase